MTDEQQIDDLRATRVFALRAAADSLGDPALYVSKSTTRGPGEPATGLMGALGGRTNDRESVYRSIDYPNALIQVAEYIVTGRFGPDDVRPEALAAAQDGADDDDVRDAIALMREALG